MVGIDALPRPRHARCRDGLVRRRARSGRYALERTGRDGRAQRARGSHAAVAAPPGGRDLPRARGRGRLLRGRRHGLGRSRRRRRRPLGRVAYVPGRVGRGALARAPAGPLPRGPPRLRAGGEHAAAHPGRRLAVARGARHRRDDGRGERHRAARPSGLAALLVAHRAGSPGRAPPTVPRASLVRSSHLTLTRTGGPLPWRTTRSPLKRPSPPVSQLPLPVTVASETNRTAWNWNSAPPRVLGANMKLPPRRPGERCASE